MIGGNLPTNTLSVTSADQLNKKTTRTIGADCLNQINFNQNAFTAEIIDSNMRQIYAATTNTYEDTALKAAVSINLIIDQ